MSSKGDVQALLPGYGESFFVLCRKDQSRLEPTEVESMTRVDPDANLVCPKCGERLMLFDMAPLPVLQIWRSDVPAGVSFSEYVEDQADELRARVSLAQTQLVARDATKH
jgi:hypothetical protein